MAITYNTPITQALCTVDKVSPTSVAAGTSLTTAVDMGKYGRLVYIIDVGTLGSSATVDFKLRAAPTSGGTYADVTGFAITQIAAGSKTAMIEISSENLVAAETTAGVALLNKYRWLKGSLTVGTAATIVGITVLGALGRNQKPESADNVAAVVEIVRPIAAD